MKDMLPSNGCNVNKEEMSEVKPPYSNTGAENTKVGIEALIDWFAPTVPLHGLEGVKRVIEDILKMSIKDFTEMPRGLNGYKAQMRCGNIAILYDGKPEMGVHIMMTGQGCRQYEALSVGSWQELCKRVIDAGGHCARMDTALDDYDGHYTVELIEEKVNKRELTSKFKKVRPDKEIDLSTPAGEDEGKTMYFGSRNSDLRIRIYDKGKKEKVPYSWVRTEVESHDERADCMMKMIVCGGDNEIGMIVAGVLRNYVNFLEPSKTDTNTSRWIISPWWVEFLGNVEKVRLTIQKAVKTLNDTVEWLENQVATSLAMVNKLARSKGKGIYRYILKGLIENGTERLKPRHYAMLKAAGVQV